MEIVGRQVSQDFDPAETAVRNLVRQTAIDRETRPEVVAQAFGASDQRLACMTVSAIVKPWPADTVTVVPRSIGRGRVLCSGGMSAEDEVMRVALLYSADCPNWREAGLRLRQALAEVGRPDVEISYQPVETDAEAVAIGFGGSPTFHVDGTDLFDVPAAGTLTCRIYTTADGVAGAPDVASLTTALRKRLGS